MIDERGTATGDGQADRRGVVLGLLALSALSGPALAQAQTETRTGAWRRAESPRFVVHGVVGEDVLREYAAKLEDFDMVLRFMHGLPIDATPPRKLDVYLVRGTPGLRRAMPGAAETLAGYYIAGATGIACVATVGRVREVENDDIMLHEYVHHFMKQYFNYAYAPWLVEGYAEYFMTMEFKTDSIIVGKFNTNRAAWLEGDWIPLDQLITQGARIGDPKWVTYYPQAWLLTHYMMSDETRYAQLQAYMKAVGGGTPSVQAMETATGKSLAALQKDLRAYTGVGLPIRTITRKRQRSIEVTVTSMPASADDLLLETVRMISPDDGLPARKAFADEVGKRAARYPGDPLAERALARARLQAEDFPAAQAVIDRRLAAAPDDVEAMELKALILMAMGDADPAQRSALYKQASSLLGRAFKIDGSRYQTLLAYARSRTLSPGYPNDNVMEALLLANELAPQVSDVTLETVRALAMRGDYPRAVALLKPLANDPHNGGSSLREMLAVMEAQAAKAATAKGAG
jgi:tetratricopeptide (TPR) repeat protein